MAGRLIVLCLLCTAHVKGLHGATGVDGPDGQGGQPAFMAMVDGTAGETTQAAAALAAYVTAVNRHIEPDPALAATYVTFWNALPATADEADFHGLVVSGMALARTLRTRHGTTAGAYRLADTLAAALTASAGIGRGPESYLSALDRVVAPRITVGGRYEFAGSLLGRADLGISADVWQKCRPVTACVAAHDALFAKAMAGVSLSAGLAARLARDPVLRQAAALPAFGDGIARLATSLDNPPAGGDVARHYWQAITTRIHAPATDPDTDTDNEELDLMLAFGRSAAQLAGAERLAGTFGVMRAPLLEWNRLRARKTTLDGFLAAATGTGLLYAGIQALSLFDAPAGSGTAAGTMPPEALANLVRGLHEANYRQHVGLRNEGQQAANALDARLAGLGVTLDIIRDDVERIESAQHSRLRASFHADDARRWAAFDADNDRCFSLRNRDTRSGRLRTEEFRRCEERFLHGAVRRAQYATRATDYLLDAHHIAPGDARFPFHHHYPLLLSWAHTDTAGALALVDPFEWQQYAAALLRLYQENPALPTAYSQRTEVLRTLRSAGFRIHEALQGLVVDGATGTFRHDLHRRALDEYQASLDALINRLRALDDPDADRYGKRLSSDLHQALPGGRKLELIEARLADSTGSAPRLALCSDSTDADFAVPVEGLGTTARRLFSAPVTASELDQAWNRTRIGAMALAPMRFSTLVPRPFLWAGLDGLGRIEVCLRRFRPEAVDFTRDEGALRNHLHGAVELSAQVDVNFIPTTTTRHALGLDPGTERVTVASYEARRQCTFAWRSDGEGCSRAACLAHLAPAMWHGDDTTDINGGRCTGASLPARLVRHDRLGGLGELADFATDVERLYWQQRAARSARLEANVRRSDEYRQATGLYLRHYALAAITLATWPDDDGEPLAPLFSREGAMAPHDVVAALVDRRQPADALRAALAERRAHVSERITRRATTVETHAAWQRMPQIGLLQETLARIDLLLAGYAPPPQPRAGRQESGAPGSDSP